MHKIAVEYRSDALNFKTVPIRYPQWPYDLEELAAFARGALSTECEDFVRSMKRDEASPTLSKTFCHPEKGPFDEKIVETNPLDLPLLRAKVQLSFTAQEAARSISEMDDFISSEGGQSDSQKTLPSNAYSAHDKAVCFWVYSLIFLVTGVVFLPLLSPVLCSDGELSVHDSRKKETCTTSTLQGERRAIETAAPLLIALKDDIPEVQKVLVSQDEEDSGKKQFRTVLKSEDVLANENIHQFST